ncbi:hypothetical protein BGX38DRAFT_443553 [Terfezia claveryi]|nr:hypothetical protein BGX38DRAFT_443553 [Terfezia claveryi]
MATYNTTFLQDFSQPTNRRDQGYQGYQGYSWAYMQSGFQGPQLPSGNGWHQKMGQQKPNNLEQSIHHIRSNEYAPFTREAEQPSIARLYLQQQYGGLGRMQQEQDYGMEDAPRKEERLMPYRRTSNSPERGGVRRAGPEWGNTQFGTKLT